MQNYVKIISKHIASDDPIVRDFITHQSYEFPFLSPEIVNEHLKRALHTNIRKEDTQLIYTNKHHITEEALPILLELLEEIPNEERHTVLDLIHELPPSVIIKHEKKLKRYIGNRMIQSYRKCESANEKELWSLFKTTCTRLERKFNHKLFSYGKKLQNKMIEKDYYNETKVTLILQQELDEEWLSINAIYAIRAVGLLQLEKLIKPIAKHLESRDDLLLEELTEAFSRFQSEEIIDVIEPYAKQDYTFITAIAILKETKHPKAIDVLEQCYPLLDDMGKEMVINALTSHFTERAFPVIEDFIKNEYSAVVYDMEAIYYGFHKVMKRPHQLMETWKEQYIEKGQQYRNYSSASSHKSVISVKVGRNDPCSCGSGKKYKRCCGA